MLLHGLILQLFLLKVQVPVAQILRCLQVRMDKTFNRPALKMCVLKVILSHCASNMTINKVVSDKESVPVFMDLLIKVKNTVVIM